MGGVGGLDVRQLGGSLVGAARAVDICLVGLAPNAHLQVFEASSVAYALQAIMISSLEFDWHGMVPGVARQLKGIARGEFGFLFCVGFGSDTPASHPPAPVSSSGW